MATFHCGCDNGGSAARYQDIKYGSGNRVASILKKGGLRCSVCGNLQGRVIVKTPVIVVETKKK